MYIFEYPKPLTGNANTDLSTLWEEYWKLIEQLRLLNEELARMRKEAGND